MHVEVDGEHYIRLTQTPTRQRMVDKYAALPGAKVWVEEVPWEAIHPRAKQGTLVCVSEPPRRRG